MSGCRIPSGQSLVAGILIAAAFIVAIDFFKMRWLLVVVKGMFVARVMLRFSFVTRILLCQIAISVAVGVAVVRTRKLLEVKGVPRGRGGRGGRVSPNRLSEKRVTRF